MKEPNHKTATADEMWEWCMLEYNSENPISKKLIQRFYQKLELLIKSYIQTNDRILEIGCGPAESSKKIFSMLDGNHFEASEYDRRYVQKINELRYPFSVTQESVYDLKRETNSFDCLIMLEVLEHLEDVETALKELFRVSKKYVIISVPHEPIWRILNCIRFRYIRDWGNTPGHINHFSISHLKREIEKYAHVQQIETPLPWIILLSHKK